MPLDDPRRNLRSWIDRVARGVPVERPARDRVGRGRRDRQRRDAETAELDAPTLRVAFWNTWLVPRIPFPTHRGVRWTGTDTGGSSRAAGMGRWLGEHADVGCLCEVFRPVERDTLIEAWDDELTVVDGPERARKGPLARPSGLMVASDGPRVLRSATHRFGTTGGRLRTLDGWGSKGGGVRRDRRGHPRGAGWGGTGAHPSPLG